MIVHFNVIVISVNKNEEIGVNKIESSYLITFPIHRIGIAFSRTFLTLGSFLGLVVTQKNLF